MPDDPVQLDIFGQEVPLEEVPAPVEDDEPNLEPGTYDPDTVPLPF